MISIHAYQYNDSDLPTHPACALNTDLCVCGDKSGQPCGACDEQDTLFPLPERCQPYTEDYFIEFLCYACGDQFTTDTREGR